MRSGHGWPMRSLPWIFVVALAGSSPTRTLNAQQPAQLAVDWNKTTVVSKSASTLQVVVNPPLRPGDPLSRRLTKR